MPTQLDRLCRPDREGIKQPFAVDDYTVATDGCVLLAVQGVSAGARAATEAQAAFMRDWLPLPIGTRTVRLADLRAFAGAAVWSSPCDECFGAGKVALCPDCGGDGDTECTCDNCGDAHRTGCSRCGGDGVLAAGAGSQPCPECDGTGKTTDLVGDAEPVSVLGVVVDRRRLARLLDCAPDAETVETAALDCGGPCLALWGDGWHARLMAMRNIDVTATFEEPAA